MWAGQSGQLWCQRTITSQPVDGWPWSRKLRLSKFKFDVHALPALGPDSAFRLAIREAGLYGFDHVAQVFGDHPKKEHDALFVDRFVAQGREVQGISIRSAFA
jgi:hypothetical protein